MSADIIDKNLYTFINTVLEEGTNKDNKQYYDDPTTVGFNLMFHFDSDANSPLFNESNTGESAIKYLNNINEQDRSKNLKTFKDILQTITKKYPYYFTDLEGLDNIYSLSPDDGYDHERILKISTLESIDFRIARFIEEYMKATYDLEYRRQMLPINLMEFDLVIVVSEIRQFRTFINNIIGPTMYSKTDLPLVVKKNMFPYNMKFINDNLTTFVYKFSRCRFDFSDSNPFLSKLTNTQPEVASNNFNIITGKLTTAHKLRFLDLLDEVDDSGELSSTGKAKTKTGLAGKLKNFAANQLDDAKSILGAKVDAFLQEYSPINMAGKALQEGLSFVDSKVKGLLQGNVHQSQFENPIGNASDETSKAILKNKETPVTADNTALPKPLRDIFLGNVYGFEDNPIQAILESSIKANLGRLF